MELRLTSGKILSISEGENIYKALKRQGVSLVASCGGKGTCGKCKVKVVEGGHHGFQFVLKQGGRNERNPSAYNKGFYQNGREILCL